MFRMDEEQLQALLTQNPSLSISKHSVTVADKKDSPKKQRTQKTVRTNTITTRFMFMKMGSFLTAARSV